MINTDMLRLQLLKDVLYFILNLLFTSLQTFVGIQKSLTLGQGRCCFGGNVCREVMLDSVFLFSGEWLPLLFCDKINRLGKGCVNKSKVRTNEVGVLTGWLFGVNGFIALGGLGFSLP